MGDELTYRIDKYSTKLPKATVDKIIREAFDLWEEVTNIKFTEKKSGKVHIQIRFEKGAHGDDADFDGPGGYRAHAFFRATEAMPILTMTRTGLLTRVVRSCF